MSDEPEPDGGTASASAADAESGVADGTDAGPAVGADDRRDGAERTEAASAADATAADATAGGETPEDATPADATTAATVRAETLRATNRWVGVATIALLSAGLGVAVRSRPLLLAAVVGVGYLAYANATEAPEPALAVSREVGDSLPEPGDRVEIRVTVENVGETALPDLRVVEQVPEALAVVDGPARTATALRPGARMTFSYTVVARRGEYDFDGLTAIARNASGSRERELDLATAATTLTCLPPIDATDTVPLRGLTLPYTGRVSTDSSGEGVEFASVREYQHGDSLSRLDWNRYARDGTLSTMEFREERMATVVVLLDLRRAAYLQAGADGLHAVDRSIDAARRLFNSLLETGDRVGIGAFSPADIWIPPGAGATHRAEARDLLSTHPALAPTPPDDRVYVRLQLRRILRRLDDDAQVVFVSPVPDDTSVYAARALQVRDHPVTVVSPDPTLTDTPGRMLAAVERSNRLNDLRTSGVRVVDWDSTESLAEALERARGRWSA